VRGAVDVFIGVFETRRPSRCSVDGNIFSLLHDCLGRAIEPITAYDSMMRYRYKGGDAP
jgi:hypothetical protein